MSRHSKIFKPNKALGYVSNHIPLIARYIKQMKEHLIVTCVGKSFHTYGCERFRLCSVSGLHDGDISCLAGNSYYTYTACGSTVYAWRRGTELEHKYLGHSDPVHLLLPFGKHLVSIDEKSSLKVWDNRSEELILELTFDNNSFFITTICHPSTYINKVLIGSVQGRLQLWNLMTSKLIYTFQGWGSSVTVLEPAPAIDVVAVGLANGKIILHNIKFDETVMEFMQDWGLVSSLSFRSDGFPIMASGSLTGHIVFWNLEERQVASQLLEAHHGAVTGLFCLPNEPLMATSSPDNSIKLWIFDMADGGARLLQIRDGHNAPPTTIHFYDNTGHNIVSAGSDSTMRVFSTVNETMNRSLGRACYNRNASKKKRDFENSLIMPSVIQFACKTTREKEWDSIVSIHHSIPQATLWSYDKKKMGNIMLLPDRLKTRNPLKDAATTLCLTQCGNFVIVGYNLGNVHRFNVQSGLQRASYGVPVAHSGPVRGLAVDGLNQCVVTGGNDSKVKFWKFKQSPTSNKGSELLSEISVGEAVSFFRAHQESSLICVALDDFTLLVIDIEMRAVVRRFIGHSAQVTDADFSPDARWIISSAMDLSIRTWDIPTAHLIDSFMVDTACIALSFSPTGEYLATAHVNYLGIFLWSNRTLFSHVSLRPLAPDAIFPVVPLPTSGSEELESEIQEGSEERSEDREQLEENLVTLSALANSCWQNILDINIIKKRNKPKEPPKIPKAAPFFLPTLPSITLQFDMSSVAKSQDGAKITNLGRFNENYTVFGKILAESCKTESFTAVIEKLKTLSPSAIDFEINSLALEGGGSTMLMLQFMKMVNYLLRSLRDFELGQAYLGIFVKVHAEAIISTLQLSDYLKELQESQLVGWYKLQDKFFYSLCVVDTLRNK